MDLNLFTGSIGYLNFKTDSFLKNILALIFNSVGVIIIALLTTTAFSNNTEYINFFEESSTKMQLWYTSEMTDLPWLNTTVPISNGIINLAAMSLLCGMVMFFAVDSYNKSQSIFGITLMIPTFILSGFQHSIVNIYYFMVYLAGNRWSIPDLIPCLQFLGVCLLGNSIGALLAKFCSGFMLQKEEK